MPKKETSKAVVKSRVLDNDELKKLGQAGTKEALAKLKAHLKSEKDFERKVNIEMAIEECEYFYYQPQNEKEEQEFLLSALVLREEDRIMDKEMELSRIEDKMDAYALQKKVHEKVLAKHKGKQEEWKYRYMEEVSFYDEARLVELKDDIEYSRAWIGEAKKLISVARYKSGIPENYLRQFDFGFDDDDDDCDCCDYSDDCDCCDDDDCCDDENYCCPDCDSDEIEEVPF